MEGPGLALCALTGAVADACTSCAALAPQRGPAVAVCVEAYAKAVLGATAAAQAQAGAVALAGALRHATEDQLKATLLPAMLRSLKRTPDAAIPSVAAALAALRVDAASLAPDLLPLLLASLRSAKEDVREGATRALRALVSNGGADVLAAAVDAMRATLEGTSPEGRLKEVHQRVGLLTGLEGLAATPLAKGTAASVMTCLTALYVADTHEDVRLAVVTALAAWVPHAGDQLPSEVLALLATGLKDTKDKEALRRGHLHVALAACRSATPAASLQAAVPALLQLARGALTKATQRWDGMAALAVLASYAGADAQVASAVDADKLWPAVLAPGSALLRSQTMAKLGARDAVVGVELGVALLRHQLPHVRRAGALEAVAQQLVLLMLHSNTAVATAARRGVAELLSSAEPSAEVAAALRSALHAWLSLHDAHGHLFQHDDPTQGWVATTRNRAAAAIYAVAGGPLDESSGPQLLLLCCYSSVQPQSGTPRGRLAVTQAVWRRVAGVLEQSQPGYVTAMRSTESSRALMDALLSTLRSDEPVDKAVAMSAVRLVAAAHPAFAFGQLLPALRAMADRTAHDSLSITDVQVYHTPEGTLLEDANKEGVYKAQVQVVDRNTRKARGRFKMYDDGDDDEEAPAPAAAAKAAATSAKAAGGKAVKEDPRELARQERLKQESALRARVVAIRTQLEDALSGLAALAQGNAERSHEHLAQLAAPVMPLLASPLVGSGRAFTTARAMASVCQWAPAGRLSGETLATALRLCMLHATGQTAGDVGDAPAVARVVNHMSAACDALGGALPAPTYAFAFPVLECVLQLPRSSPLHSACCSVLARNVQPERGVQLPYGPTLRLLYRMIELNTLPPDVDVAEIMTACCTGLAVAADAAAADGLVLAFDGLLSPAPQARAAALAALSSIPDMCGASLAQRPGLTVRLFVAVHDTDEAIARAARAVWEECPRTLPDSHATEVLPLLARASEALRTSACAALVDAMRELPHTAQPTLARLFGFYADCKLPEGRLAAVRVLHAAAGLLTSRDLPVVCTFLIRVLSDQEEDIRTEAVTAGCAIIDAHGQAHLATLQPMLENYLSQQAQGDSEQEAQRDHVRAGVVVLLGALAKHLPREDPQVRRIISRLEEVLSVPSEAVQRSVSDCLPPLMAALDEAERAALLQRLLLTLTTGPKYGHRRGAAFGIAGAVKSLGISALKAYGTMDALKAAVEDKQSPLAREGALLAFECLCLKLGRLFEPYVINILPLLLASFGDSSVGVREAAEGRRMPSWGS
jgi:hypothetical protein